MSNQIDNDAKIIADSNWGFGGHKIVRNSSGHIYVVQINDSGYLELHKSTDDGDTWSNITTFNDAITIIHPCIDVDGNDNVYITYCYGASSPYTMKLKKVTPANVITTPVTETIYFETKTPNSYVRAYDDTVHLVWIENTYDLSTESVDIISQISSDYGVSFSSNIDYNLTTTHLAMDEYQPIIGLDLDSSYNIAVAVYYPNYYHMIKFLPNGTFISDTQMTGALDATVQRGSDFVLNKNDEIWNAFFYYSSYQWRIKTYNDGSHLNLAEIVTSFKPGNMVIGCDNDNNIYIYYTKTDEKLYLRKYISDTDTWEAEVTVTTGDGMRPSCELHVLPGKSFIHYTFFSD